MTTDLSMACLTSAPNTQVFLFHSVRSCGSNNCRHVSRNASGHDHEAAWRRKASYNSGCFGF